MAAMHAGVVAGARRLPSACAGRLPRLEHERRGAAAGRTDEAAARGALGGGGDRALHGRDASGRDCRRSSTAVCVRRPHLTPRAQEDRSGSQSRGRSCGQGREQRRRLQGTRAELRPGAPAAVAVTRRSPWPQSAAAHGRLNLIASRRSRALQSQRHRSLRSILRRPLTHIVLELCQLDALSVDASAPSAASSYVKMGRKGSVWQVGPSVQNNSRCLFLDGDGIEETEIIKSMAMKKV